MLDFSLMLRVKLPVVHLIHQQCSKFTTGANIKATGHSKLKNQVRCVIEEKELDKCAIKMDVMSLGKQIQGTCSLSINVTYSPSIGIPTAALSVAMYQPMAPTLASAIAIFSWFLSGRFNAREFSRP